MLIWNFAFVCSRSKTRRLLSVHNDSDNNANNSHDNHAKHNNAHNDRPTRLRWSRVVHHPTRLVR